MIRLPSGRDVDLDGCPTRARPRCPAHLMLSGPQPDRSDGDMGRLAIEREVCRNNAVEWREVARMLATQGTNDPPSPPCEGCGAVPDERCARGCPVAGGGDDGDASEEALRQNDRGL